MSSKKRKGTDGDAAAASSHGASSGQSRKRQRREAPAKSEKSATSRPPLKDLNDAKPLTRVSILKEEEKAFPRGGGGILTAVEHKQIQLQADRDVLFEDSKALSNDDGPGDGQELGSWSGKKHSQTKSKKLSVVQEADQHAQAEGLKFKRIVRGAMVLGQVSRISDNEVLLDLPNNLTGCVPIVAVSAVLTARVNALMNEDNEVEEGLELDLKKFFYLGQYLRGYVTSTMDDSNTQRLNKKRKRIELSLDPKQANPGLAGSSIVVNSMVQASVISVEDHGLVMDLGIPDRKGFMSSKELPQMLDASNVEPGTVFLCLVTGMSSNGMVVKLSADHEKLGDLHKSHFVGTAPTIDVALPGVAVELLVTSVSPTCIIGEFIGTLRLSADVLHSGAGTRSTDIESKYKVGSKIKARIIFSITDGQSRSIGVSVLDHVLRLRKHPPMTGNKSPTEILPLSSTIEQAKVINVEAGLGLYVDVGVKGLYGFVHVSRVSDTRVATLSQSIGAYRSGTSHKGRILGYNAMDGLFLVSFQQSVLEQPFLRIEDVPIGQVVSAKVERLVLNARGVGGLILHLAQGISGLVTEMHMSDVHLEHPERKFKEGAQVTARVLSTDLERRQIRLTLKKSLVIASSQPWFSYSNISVGDESLGTVVNVTLQGAVLLFYGDVRAFLPVSEMSDGYIQDPIKHLQIGQVVRVRAISVDAVDKRMIVSCRTALVSDAMQATALERIAIGDMVSGTVTEKSSDNLIVDLKDSGLRAMLRVGHMTDGSDQRNASALKHIRVGQFLQDLVVIESFMRKRAIGLTRKPSLVRAVKAGELVAKLEDLIEGQQVDGFVKNTTEDGVFIQLVGGLTGLLHRSQLLEDQANTIGYGLPKDTSISVQVKTIDLLKQHFWLTTVRSDAGLDKVTTTTNSKDLSTDRYALINPVDGVSSSITDFTPGQLTMARIVSIKATQLNVRLADNVQGRIDVSEAFNNWDEIKDPKHPLRSFHAHEPTIAVRVLGIHDARNHRFLPISHRGAKVPVFELSAKVGDDKGLSTLDQIGVGSLHTAFVNNVTAMCLWVNLSPNVRGRIERMDISDDVSILNDLNTHFPVGSALRVRVKNVDLNTGRLDLSAKLSAETPLTFDKLTTGTILAGRITKVNEHSLMVQLSGDVAGHVGLTDIVDDYAEADPTKYSKNDIVKVCVLDIDKANKKVALSMRASKVLSSSLPVKDRSYSSLRELKVGDIVRGFVKSVADVGLFVSISHSVTAFIRVAELFDAFVKDWKSHFEVDRLVTGRITALDESTQHTQMSLKASVVSDNYTPPITYNDLVVGQVITGRIRKVEVFGAFIVVENSHNVSGLCHRSEVAEQRVEDVTKLYSEGDVVKAKVLKLEPEKRRISFGLKASYFADEDIRESGEENEIMSNTLIIGSPEGSVDDVVLDDAEQLENQVAAGSVNILQDSIMFTEDKENMNSDIGLNPGAFDWNGTLDEMDNVSVVESEPDAPPRKKRKKPEIKIDETGDLDKLGPRSSSDFERLLLGQRDSSSLWIRYMAFQLELSEVEEARKVAERALREINIREQEEKLNVWVAYLNLENAYGSDESVEEIFRRACELHDPQEMHERLTSIFIESGKHEKADELFQTMTKKKSFTPDPKLWLNYAIFLFDTLSDPPRGRDLLGRAMKCVPSHLHRDLVTKFAQLEFRCKNGDTERGRTIFEGLLDTYPRRWDLWDVFVDHEIQKGEKENVRRLFERMAAAKMKSRRAKYVFKKWLDFEEREGDSRSVERVKAKAAAYVEAQKKVTAGNNV